MKTLSEKNEYHISKRRYLELKNFCLQYNEWKAEIKKLDNGLRAYDVSKCADSNWPGDPTAVAALKKIRFEERISMINNAAHETDPELASYIIEAVANGYSYDYLHMQRSIPVCREVYYKLYRRFFWKLDKIRN